MSGRYRALDRALPFPALFDRRQDGAVYGQPGPQGGAVRVEHSRIKRRPLDVSIFGRRISAAELSAVSVVWKPQKDASVLTNQEIKWAALLVVIVSFARVQLRKRWPDRMRQWEHLIDLLILGTMIVLMMAALSNWGKPPSRPMPAGPARIACVTWQIIPSQCYA